MKDFQNLWDFKGVNMKLILTVGPSGAGKSTYAKELEVQGYVRVSQDDAGKEGHLKLFNEALALAKPIVVDRLNFSYEQRKRYLSLAEAAGYVTEIVVFHVPYAECFERCLARQGHPTIRNEHNARQALDMFFKNYQKPVKGEVNGSISYKNFEYKVKHDVIVVDLDGTLCDIEHRKHFVENQGQKKDWKGFFEAMENDKVNTPVLKTSQAMVSKSVLTVLCSGRPDNYRKLTEEWLNGYDIGYVGLYMRHRSDFRPDNTVKEQILDFELLPRYNILYVLDDRDQVVQMWRRRGIPCFQVAEGDF